MVFEPSNSLLVGIWGMVEESAPIAVFLLDIDASEKAIEYEVVTRGLDL